MTTKTKQIDATCTSLAADLEPSWRRAWQGVGAAGDGRATFNALLAKHSEVHRKYHTLQHLSECLAAFQQAINLAPHAAEVEMALWFHDAIYDVRRSDNEARSAQWAQTELSAGGARPESVGLVSSLIHATRHDGVPSTPDEQVLVDIDLSILGASEKRFAEYERQIREEYAFVPGFLFRRRRRAILSAFLGRHRIYSTEQFHTTLEQNARQNLQRLLQA